MWFKNLVVFHIDQPLPSDTNQWTKGLEDTCFKPCGPQQAETLGWVSPLGDLSDELIHQGSGAVLLCARREERLLPASVVREALAERVAEIEDREQRKVGRKQRLELRDQLTFDMMPRAFTRSTLIQGMVLPEAGLIVVDTASRNRAEQWMSLLRVALGSLSVSPLVFKQSIPVRLTGWLDGSVPRPGQVEIGDECVLQSPDDEGGVIRCRRQDLEGAEIAAHLKAGKRVTQLAIDWNESLSFVVNEEVEVKRLRLADSVVEQDEVDGVNDPAAEFDARFNLLALELSRFLPALFEALGGLGEAQNG